MAQPHVVWKLGPVGGSYPLQMHCDYIVILNVPGNKHRHLQLGVVWLVTK